MSSAPSGTRIELVIRPKLASDDDFIASLSEVAFHSYNQQAANWVGRMMAAPGAHTLVATIDEAPVGMAILELRRAPRPYGPFADPAVAHLDAIAVAPNLRGHGIGGYLLEVALEEAAHRGALAITLMTAARNHQARRLFSSLGFVVFAAMDGAYAGGERALLMHRTLVE